MKEETQQKHKPNWRIHDSFSFVIKVNSYGRVIKGVYIFVMEVIKLLNLIIMTKFEL